MLLLTYLPDEEAKDLYTILGIKRGATKREIHAAYRRLSKLFHPDSPGGDPEKFRELKDAYDTLINAETRFYYDTLGYTPEQMREGVDYLVDLIIAAYNQGIRVERKVREFVEAVINKSCMQLHENAAEAKAVSTKLLEFIGEAEHTDNYVMTLAIEAARGKLESLNRSQRRLEEQQKQFEIVRSLIPHVSLKNKGVTPTWDWEFGQQPLYMSKFTYYIGQ